jgi:hypothetical protein
MSKQRTEAAPEPDAQAPATPSGPPAKRFRDTRFISRTLVLEDGRTAAVADSEIATSEPDWITYLQQNPEFQPIE